MRCNSAFFTHLELMSTILHPLNLCKNYFYDFCVKMKFENTDPDHETRDVRTVKFFSPSPVLI